MSFRFCVFIFHFIKTFLFLFCFFFPIITCIIFFLACFLKYASVCISIYDFIFKMMDVSNFHFNFAKNLNNSTLESKEWLRNDKKEQLFGQPILSRIQTEDLSLLAMRSGLVIFKIFLLFIYINICLFILNRKYQYSSSNCQTSLEQYKRNYGTRWVSLQGNHFFGDL